MVRTVKYYVGLSNKDGELNEDQVNDLIKIVSDYFEAFTVYPAKEYWNRQGEKTFVIEIVDFGTPLKTFIDFEDSLSAWLKATNQECVLKLVVHSNASFVNAESDK